MITKVLFSIFGLTLVVHTPPIAVNAAEVEFAKPVLTKSAVRGSSDVVAFGTEATPTAAAGVSSDVVNFAIAATDSEEWIDDLDAVASDTEITATAAAGIVLDEAAINAAGETSTELFISSTTWTKNKPYLAMPALIKARKSLKEIEEGMSKLFSKVKDLRESIEEAASSLKEAEEAMKVAGGKLKPEQMQALATLLHYLHQKGSVIEADAGEIGALASEVVDIAEQTEAAIENSLS